MHWIKVTNLYIYLYVFSTEVLFEVAVERVGLSGI